MAAIVLDSVRKTYPGAATPALDEISLTIEQGSIVTLLGPSGCGKTTTLRIIAGFERPDSGTVTIGDVLVAGPGAWIPPERRGVGMVFQEHALFPHLDVAGNVGFNLPRDVKAGRVRDALALVGLAGYDRRMPHELSGGQQQRVALARALAPRPHVVLFDEPFASLDADLRVHMRAEVRRILTEARITAVFVTHDQSDALAISDTIVVMRDGRIEQVGTPRDVYQFPHTRWLPKILCDVTSPPIVPTRCGYLTSPTSARGRAGPISPSCSMCTRGASWAGSLQVTCARASSPTLSTWRSHPGRNMRTD